ncbi:MAG: lytic murein transglycosylase [Desulfovibrio sp.]|nr:lytic murein transglycosylase [Desulfovibrio sp.]
MPRLFFSLVFGLWLLTGCSAALCAQELAPVWQELRTRLAKDGVAGDGVDALLLTLPAKPTQSPMGRKMLALYKKAFFPQAPVRKTDYYKGVVTQANARTCLNYLQANASAFAAAQQRYGVPPEIAVALLFVETRLGTVLADVPENALYTLASMAVSRTPQSIDQWLPKMRGVKKRMAWLAKKMPERADWAYAEVRALIVYMLANAIAPEALPSSIYGAVGLCQFMPSNIAVYAADGDGDGRIDLFGIADAAASLARYLSLHGWKEGLSPAAMHALLMKYNHSKVYANTILALAELIRAQEKVQP